MRKHYPGGESGFRTDYPLAAEDRYLFGIGSMSGGELEGIRHRLTSAGLALPACSALGDGRRGAIEAHPDIRFEQIAEEPFPQWDARLACDDFEEMAAEGAPIVRWMMEKGWELHLPDDPRAPPRKAPATAKVTSGKIEGPWLGGKGSLTPFRPTQTATPATQSPPRDETLDILAPGQEDPEPAMKGARIALEAAMLKLADDELTESAPQDNSPGPEIPSEVLISRVWQNAPENLRPLLSARECRAVERFVSRASSDPWEVKRLLNEGLAHAFHQIWSAPALYGIA